MSKSDAVILEMPIGRRAAAKGSKCGSADVKHMKVNGTRLAYVEEGAGEPVVFVHGAVSDMRAWDAYRAGIAKHWRFITYTQRYFGIEDWPDQAKSFTRETHIADLIGFVEALHVGPVHLVTWSYGGDVGTYAALRRPDLFRSMVHYEPSVGILLEQLPGGAEAQADFAKTLAPAVAAAKVGRHDVAALWFLEAVCQVLPGEALQEPERWQRQWRDNGRTVLPFLRLGASEPITGDALTGLRVPTLVVRGEHSHERFSMIAERLVQCQPNASLVTMAGVNHDGPYRSPDEFESIIKEFFEAAPSESRFAASSFID